MISPYFSRTYFLLCISVVVAAMDRTLPGDEIDVLVAEEIDEGK